MKKTFNTSTQVYPEVAHEKSSNPKNYFLERFEALGAQYRQVRRNNETFSADILPFIYRRKTKYLMLWSGLGSKCSAVYNFPSKCAESTLDILQQFIREHGIPASIITDGEKSENFSVGWIKTCAKYKIDQLCSEAYKQNQNYVERFIRDGKSGISKFRSATGIRNCEHMYEMWQHFSDTQNHMSRRSLKK